MTFDRLIQFAWDKGEAYRSRTGFCLAVRSTFCSTTGGSQSGAFPFPEQAPRPCITSTPRTTSSTSSKVASRFPRLSCPRQNTQRAKNTYSTLKDVTSWASHILAAATSAAQSNRSLGRVGYAVHTMALICYTSYLFEDISTKCTLPVHDWHSIVTNLKALSGDLKAQVHHKSFKPAAELCDT